MLRLRELRREESQLLARIERAERIREQYVLVDGQLEIRSCDIDVPGWHPEELATLILRLEAVVDSGGVVLGAWDDDAFVGLASLGTKPVGKDTSVSKLDILHVSRSHRRLGIGARLTSALAKRARIQGATSLYISATPTRNTVDAYLAMGAVLAPAPDPAMLLLEPDDIHLILAI